MNFRLLREAGIVVLGLVAYFGARGLTAADPEVSLHHANHIVHFEKNMGFFWERTLQQRFISPGITTDVVNWIYIWGHWPVVLTVLAWLAWRHPGQYRVIGLAMVISGAIGVVFFTLYPMAPPRLANLGLVDTVTVSSHSYRVLQPPAFVNQYAAMPSLHFGWDLLVGLAVWRNATRLPVRLIGLAMPVAMGCAVILTGNHYFSDVAVGGVVSLTGFWLSRRLAARRALASADATRTSPASRQTAGPVVAMVGRVPVQRPGNGHAGRSTEVPERCGSPRSRR